MTRQLPFQDTGSASYWLGKKGLGAAMGRHGSKPDGPLDLFRIERYTGLGKWISDNELRGDQFTWDFWSEDAARPSLDKLQKNWPGAAFRIRRVPPKFYLQRVPLDSGGYDGGGAYWGLGAPLYYYASDCGRTDDWIRCSDRQEAKAQILKLHPSARFYR